jgi:hypothetical protein
LHFANDCFQGKNNDADGVFLQALGKCVLFFIRNFNSKIYLKRTYKIFVFCTTILITVAQFSFTPKVKHDKGQLIVRFKHVVENELLKLDSANYKNELGQSYTISKFKYYIGQIHLKNSKGKDFIFKDYFLINEDEELSKQIKLNNIPNGNYKSISFILGVDSLHNCSGAQSGALDPLNAMFWAWNTGYIFLKLEGKSSFSKSSGNMFEFHIGGYKQPTNCIRKIELDLTKNPIIITNKTSFLELKTNAGELLKSPTTIDFSILSSVTDLKNADLIANNYKDMFSVLSVNNEN